VLTALLLRANMHTSSYLTFTVDKQSWLANHLLQSRNGQQTIVSPANKHFLLGLQMACCGDGGMFEDNTFFRMMCGARPQYCRLPFGRQQEELVALV
jgi:hypothetical protein